MLYYITGTVRRITAILAAMVVLALCIADAKAQPVRGALNGNRLFYVSLNLDKSKSPFELFLHSASFNDAKLGAMDRIALVSDDSFLSAVVDKSWQFHSRITASQILVSFPLGHPNISGQSPYDLMRFTFDGKPLTARAAALPGVTDIKDLPKKHSDTFAGGFRAVRNLDDVGQAARIKLDQEEQKEKAIAPDVEQRSFVGSRFFDVVPLGEQRLLVAVQGHALRPDEMWHSHWSTIFVMECNLGIVRGKKGDVDILNWHGTWKNIDSFAVGFVGPFRLFPAKTGFVVLDDEGSVWSVDSARDGNRKTEWQAFDLPVVCVLDDIPTGDTHIFSPRERLTITSSGELLRSRPKRSIPEPRREDLDAAQAIKILYECALELRTK